ncbi:hypothetical protein EYF80_025131 [Liparis tanakae]|uniref:Uncharacterized protein n=1 Tax=Liparis tanakae TaxID=230148 RepID=A0A4Z2HIE0_9TELE|nr:hypothetical protein EYF80_025131 [Liparis tanakae]
MPERRLLAAVALRRRWCRRRPLASICFNQTLRTTLLVVLCRFATYTYDIRISRRPRTQPGPNLSANSSTDRKVTAQRPPGVSSLMKSVVPERERRKWTVGKGRTPSVLHVQHFLST